MSRTESDDHDGSTKNLPPLEGHPKEAGEDAAASLKYSLLGPSLLKAGQDAVDQSKVSEIIYEASKGSKFFNREEARDKTLTAKIDQILDKKRQLVKLDLSHELRVTNNLINQLELSRDLSQYIVHVDCDAFYACVELLDRPELKDLPFAVGGGVLTTCNYVARKYGCRSGMAGFVAKKLCPELILLPINFDKYTAKAREVREIIAEYDSNFESASIDEAYLNITNYCTQRAMGPGDAVAKMRSEIHEKTGITVSAGIAANCRLAKVCSNINKPNGQYILPNERVAIMEFMRALPCRKVNGIGRVFERELAAVGIHTLGDIYTNKQYLRRLFGEKTHEFLIHCYLGLGRTCVKPAETYERKSVGTESTFRDMSDPAQLRDKLRRTSEDLEQDLRRAECKGRTLCLKVKLHTFEVLTRQAVLPRAIYLATDLYNYALPMLTKLEQEIPGMKLRLMGLRCTHLVSTKKPDTMAFFGFKPRDNQSEDCETTSAKKNANMDSGERGGQPLRTSSASSHGQDHDTEEIQLMARDSPRQASPQTDGRETAARLRPLDEEPLIGGQPEWWDCPICNRPQVAEERPFNDHIDLCLSRQAIRDTIQKEAAMPSPEPKASKIEHKKSKARKRGRHAASPDPKQKRLCFG
ncbi:hypothetical protein B0T20DRAFT_81230 [Sordaria brevicollis]|uniref:DNA polymerase kappa n=1 Tax=Sordaria brevicollis TaxID=83679 RepID=A0AAE0P1E5_SORBR|nr:hypothetical protein B0T20DRAFT_81230 [Sordaria brevicollis]